MKQDLVCILKDIFRSAGYNIVDSYQHDLIAEKSGQKTYIRFAIYPDVAEMNSFISMIGDGAGLYIINGKADKDVMDHARSTGLMVWDRDDVALQIGRAVLADIEGRAGELDLFVRPVKKSTPNVDDVAKMAIKSIFGASPTKEESRTLLSRVPQGRPTVADDTEPVGRRLERAPIQAPDAPVAPVEVIPTPTPAPELPPDSILLNLRSAPLSVSKDRAVSIAKPHIYTYQSAVLKLVPFWHYQYHLKSEQRYMSKVVDITGEGAGFMNALNGKMEDLALNAIGDSVAIPDVPHEIKSIIVTKEEAQKSLISWVIEEHTKDLRFDNSKGDTLISEHKRFKPAVSDIELVIDLVYMPIWDVRGARNSIEINGCTAEVLREPVDDDAEFV